MLWRCVLGGSRLPEERLEEADEGADHPVRPRASPSVATGMRYSRVNVLNVQIGRSTDTASEEVVVSSLQREDPHIERNRIDLGILRPTWVVALPVHCYEYYSVQVSRSR